MLFCRTHVYRPKMLIEISEFQSPFLSGMPLQKAGVLCIIQSKTDYVALWLLNRRDSYQKERQI